MLLRIALIVAVVTSLGALGVSFKVSQKIDQVTEQRDQYQQDAQRSREAETRARNEAQQARTELEDANSKLSEAESDLALTRSRLSEQTTRANDLNQRLIVVEQQRNEAQQGLARWNALGRTVEQILAMIEDYDATVQERDALVTENGVLSRKVEALTNRINLLTIQDYEVKLPDSITGTVQAVDPKFQFVVLNIGRNQNLKEQAKLTVARDGKLVGKVRVASLEEDRSVANILPGWDIGNIHEGDEVIPSYEAIGGEY